MSVGTYETEIVSGYYGNTGGLKLSIVGANYSSNPAANYAPYQAVSVTFAGKPEAGKTWVLLPEPSNGYDLAPGTGTLLYADTEKFRKWFSTSGTLRIDSVTDPRAVPVSYPAGMLKAVKLTLVDVTMAPDADDANTTGTFTLHGEGRIELMSGMDQP